MGKEKVDLDMDIAHYETAILEISKALDFLPNDPVARKAYLDGLAKKLMGL